VSFLISPPDVLGVSKSEKDFFSLTGVLIVDQIWKLRNSKVHEGCDVVMEKLERNIVLLGNEFSLMFGSAQHSPPPIKKSYWQRPPEFAVKLNCDAAVGSDFSSIVVVARNWRGTVVLAISKKFNTTIPLQAEAEALYWAANIAVELGVVRVFIESDSKSCVDCVNGSDIGCLWRIHTTISQITSFLSSHPAWSIGWVRREANQAAHFLAGWALRSGLWGVLFIPYAPLCFVNAVDKDLSCIYV
jgi:ribonuclease HI